MRKISLCLAILFISAFSQAAMAVANGDTQSTRVTTCGFAADTCTTTITDMVYMDGKWVITSVRHITVRNPARPPIRE